MMDRILPIAYIILALIGSLTNIISCGTALLIMIIAVYGFRIETAIRETRQSRQKDPQD